MSEDRRQPFMKEGKYTIGALCECRHAYYNHEGGECLKCDCREFRYTKKWKTNKIIKKGWVAMNKGEFDDLNNISYFNTKKEAMKFGKGQDVLAIEIKFALQDGGENNGI